MKKKKKTIRQQRNERKTKQKQEIREKEQKQKQEEFNKLRDEKYEKEKKERHEDISIINEMNDILSNWELDLSRLARIIAKDYPISTILIDHIKTISKEESSELQLWELVRKFIVLEEQKVKMDFQDYNENFYHLLYCSKDYLKMVGIDLLYMIYILDNQLLKKPNELGDILVDNSMKNILSKMEVALRNHDETFINFSI